jgi:hypothetical protein
VRPAFQQTGSAAHTAVATEGRATLIKDGVPARCLVSGGTVSVPAWRIALGRDIIIPMEARLCIILTGALTVAAFRSDGLAGLPAAMRPAPGSISGRRN